jgi:hypothetical protein
MGTAIVNGSDFDRIKSALKISSRIHPRFRNGPDRLNVQYIV